VVILARVRIALRLRDGSEHTLALDEHDVETTFLQLTSGRRRDLLEDWVAVEPGNDARRAAVRGDEIVEVRLVES
jgi:hypothetical protein